MSMEKFNNNIKNVNLIESYKFQIHPILKSQRRIPIVKVPLRFRVTPDSLLELSGNIVKKLPLPYVFNWTNLDVIKWIQKLGYPEYIKCFRKNFINGYSLIFVDASALISMNIQNFHHIQKITENIRKLYGIEMINYINNFSSILQKPLTYLKLYYANTGLKYQKTSAIDLFRKMKIIPKESSYDEHWTILEKCLQRRQQIEFVLIGRNRNKLYKMENNLLDISGKIDLEDKNPLCICYIPPCTCKNSKYQNIKSSKSRNISIITDCDKNLQKLRTCEGNQKLLKKIDKNLNCIFIRGTCIWKSKSFDPESTLPILSKESMRNYSASVSDLPAIKIDITQSNAMKIKIK